MAKMKPESVDKFQNDSEQQAYSFLQQLDDTCTVIYEPSIGIEKRRTPDFIVLSEKYGLVVLDVKHIKLDNIKKSDQQFLTYNKGLRLQNFYQTVKKYAYTVNNQLIRELKDNPKFVHPKEHKLFGKLTFPHSSGILLSISDADKYTKSDVAKLLSLDENDFIIINKLKNPKLELQDFIKNLQRPFTVGLSTNMQDTILKKIYIESDATSTDFIRTMSQFSQTMDEKFIKKLYGSHFEKSRQLKKNILEYTKFAQKSIETANKNLNFGFENIIERLKEYKAELEDEKFTVAVFGYFSTGKSTFLNTLMGTDKLPMDEDRSTATFTRLKHCDEVDGYENEDMQVVYKDELDISISYKESINILNFEEENQKKFIEFENINIFKDELILKLKTIKLRDYSMDQRDRIKNAKRTLDFILENNIPYGTTNKIKKEDIYTFLTDDKKAFGISEVIYYLNHDLLNDIEIVDTPGYGSENTMDTFKTEEFVKNANILILLTEGKDPMSKESEHVFLETYAKLYSKDDVIRTDNLFIVANKVDESRKNTQEIKESIHLKIEENWEDELIVKDDHIFTLSSKYHYDISLNGKSDINSNNINDKDLNNFIQFYSNFLTKNKDKEFIQSNFKHVDETLTELEDNFKQKLNEMDRDINDIQAKKKKFAENRTEIDENYSVFRNAISNIVTELHKDTKGKLDKQKLNNVEQTTKSYNRFLADKDLQPDKANKKLSKEFFTKLVKAIGNDVVQKNNVLFKEYLDKQMLSINRQIEKYSKELEVEYGINGLDKKINVKKINEASIKEVEFKKGLVNSVMDFISFGYFVTSSAYAKQMVEQWKDTYYSSILSSINNSNNDSITQVLEEFKEQNNSIVKSIGTKLDDIEKSLHKKRQNKEEYNKKLDNLESTFEKIDNYKTIIKEQEKTLYEK